MLRAVMDLAAMLILMIPIGMFFLRCCPRGYVSARREMDAFKESSNCSLPG